MIEQLLYPYVYFTNLRSTTVLKGTHSIIGFVRYLWWFSTVLFDKEEHISPEKRGEIFFGKQQARPVLFVICAATQILDLQN